VRARQPDLAVLDLQIGSMGAMAVTMGLRLDESSGLLPHVRVLMLLDRKADVHLAKRCGAEEWLVKPVDALTLKRAARRVMGVAATGKPLVSAAPARRWKSVDSPDETADADTTPEEDAASAG